MLTNEQNDRKTNIDDRKQKVMESLKYLRTTFGNAKNMIEFIKFCFRKQNRSKQKYKTETLLNHVYSPLSYIAVNLIYIN